jgi:UDP-glucose 4-epimerase
MDVIDKIETITEKSMIIELRPPRNGDLPSLYSDTTKMRKELTFEPEHDMVSIIESMRG